MPQYVLTIFDRICCALGFCEREVACWNSHVMVLCHGARSQIGIGNRWRRPQAQRSRSPRNLPNIWGLAVG